jgi:Cytochrome C'
MKRWLFCCMGVAVCGLVAVSLSDLSAADKDKVTPIEEIMEKAHKKGDGILPAIGKELQGAKVNWDAVESKTKDLLLLAGDLGKNTPPKGEKVSWDKLTKAYVTNVEGLQKAAESKDVAKAKASQKALAGSCTGCHSRHKG